MLGQNNAKFEANWRASEIRRFSSKKLKFGWYKWCHRRPFRPIP